MFFPFLRDEQADNLEAEQQAGSIRFAAPSSFGSINAPHGIERLCRRLPRATDLLDRILDLPGLNRPLSPDAFHSPFASRFAIIDGEDNW